MPSLQSRLSNHRSPEFTDQRAGIDAGWLLEFMAMDLSQADGNLLGQLQERVLRFVGTHDEGSRNLPQKANLIEWQGKLNRKLADLSKGRSWKMGVSVTLQSTQRRIVLSPGFKTNTSTHWPFLHKAFECLATSSFRFCSNEKCKKLFVGNKRGIYCSVKCRSAVNKRTFKQKRQS